MIHRLHEVWDSFLHLFFPHVCAGCGSDALGSEETICIHCLYHLPKTDFDLIADNPVEKIFWGRIPLVSACSIYYFSKDSLLQSLLHQLKYRAHHSLGPCLGKEMGKLLARSDRFLPVDGILPVPLHPSREKQRGYNQAGLLAEGIGHATNTPLFTDMLHRTTATSTQTKKNRLQRWENIQDKFICSNNATVRGKHLLLVDDVITTGATLESCGQCLLAAGAASIRIATLAYASN